MALMSVLLPAPFGPITDDDLAGRRPSSETSTIAGAPP